MQVEYDIMLQARALAPCNSRPGQQKGKEVMCGEKTRLLSRIQFEDKEEEPATATYTIQWTNDSEEVIVIEC